MTSLESAPSTFDVLHALRVKGVSSTEALASFLVTSPDELGPILTSTETEGLLKHREGRRVSGWVLTEEGRSEHAAQLAANTPEATRARLAEPYGRFFALNGAFKALCVRWLDAQDQGDDMAPLLDQLEQVRGEVNPIIVEAVDVVPAFRGHLDRLERAVERARAGESEYVTSPHVASCHTVWFELHEDFLVRLGRNRRDEGSY